MISSKYFALSALVMVLSFMMESAHAYTANQRQVWYPAKAKAGIYKNCKIRAKTEAEYTINKTCGSLTGSAYQSCASNSKSLRKQLYKACVVKKSKFNMYEARNTPIDILGGILTPANIANSTHQS